MSEPAHELRADIEAIVRGRHGNPFGILGPHAVTHNGQPAVAVRVFVPDVADAWVLDGADAHPMHTVHKDGFFEAVLTGRSLPLEYRLRLRSVRGDVNEFHDAYSFGSVLGEFDLHLLGEGRHYRNFERLGAHVRELNGVRGVSFAVWAPNARRVSVVGDFNHWDGRRHPMRFHPGVGVWDIFIPDLLPGALYKFELIGADGHLLPLKSDPYGLAFEVRPRTASIVYELDRFTWHDHEWMESRAQRNALDAPMAFYEVHLGSWLRDPARPDRLLSYTELAVKLADYVKQMGFTHVELLPVSEHPYDGSWGYQPLGYFAPTSRHGGPADFMHFVDHLHQNGIGVLIDWVPAHFPRDDHGLRRFDGTCLYEHMDPRQGEHPDWGTMVFNYGRNEVANFLLGNALFWLEKYHIDGFRVDAVASMLYLDYARHDGEWVPNRYGGKENLEAIEFLRRLNELVHGQFPGVLTVAEESTAWTGVSRPTYLGGLGFSLKWNMGWMNDTLRYMHRDPVHRKYHQNDLTFSLLYAFSENFVLPLSHDEVVHGKGALLDKMPGDFWQRFANLRLLLGYMYGHPGKKLLFMGGEFGQWQEWRHKHSLDWHLLQYAPHQGLQRLVRDLNHLLVHEPALHKHDFDWTGFQWVDLHDHDSSVLSFLRRGDAERDTLLFVMNFTPVVRRGYRIGVPVRAFWQERLNTDAEIYGGSNVGNFGGTWADEIPWHGFPCSLSMTLPPLAVVVFQPQW
jgi:1,4-alpha-glucan branching enzyme